jgi:hypothetical protein
MKGGKLELKKRYNKINIIKKYFGLSLLPERVKIMRNIGVIGNLKTVRPGYLKRRGGGDRKTASTTNVISANFTRFKHQIIRKIRNSE